MWVPLVEYGEASSPGSDYFVRKEINALLAADPQIDTIVLGCTHYPLLLPKIRQYVPAGITILSQGDIVAASLEDYLHRHADMEARLTRGGSCRYLTTDSAERFSTAAGVFLGEKVTAARAIL